MTEKSTPEEYMDHLERERQRELQSERDRRTLLGARYMVPFENRVVCVHCETWYATPNNDMIMGCVFFIECEECQDAKTQDGG